MSYYDDYIADGLCCEGCGGYLDGSEPGFSRFCDGCRKSVKAPAKAKKRGRRHAD